MKYFKYIVIVLLAISLFSCEENEMEIYTEPNTEVIIPIDSIKILKNRNVTELKDYYINTLFYNDIKINVVYGSPKYIKSIINTDNNLLHIYDNICDLYINDIHYFINKVDIYLKYDKFDYVILYTENKQFKLTK